MIQWRSLFDRVVVVRYAGYDPVRGPALVRELDRVGLHGIVENQWTVSSPYLTRFANSMRISRTGAGLGPFSELVFGMYSAMKTSLLLGARRVLLLEDDIEFVSDLDMLSEAFTALPSDYLVGRLSWMFGECSVEPSTTVKWVQELGEHPKDSGAACWSADAMEHFVASVEGALLPGGVLGFCDTDGYFPPERNRVYLSVPLVARQREYGTRMCRKRNYNAHYARFLASCGYGGK